MIRHITAGRKASGRSAKFYRCTDPNIGRPKAQAQAKAPSRILRQWNAAVNSGTVTFDADGIGHWS